MIRVAHPGSRSRMLGFYPSGSATQDTSFIHQQFPKFLKSRVLPLEINFFNASAYMHTYIFLLF
jgi:hypothetical protein